MNQQSERVMQASSSCSATDGSYNLGKNFTPIWFNVQNVVCMYILVQNSRVIDVVCSQTHIDSAAVVYAAPTEEGTWYAA